MDWLLKLPVVWLCVDVLIIATGWYAATIIRPQFPNWWRRHIADELPLV